MAMAISRRTHIILAVLAVLLLVIGIYAIIQSVSGSSSPSSSSGSAISGDPPSSDTSDSASSGTDNPSGPTKGNGETDKNGEGEGDGGSRGSGGLRFPGPTLNNVYPQEKNDKNEYQATGGCLVMVNSLADVPVRIRSISVRGGSQVRISARPCSTPAQEAAWNVDLNVIDPVNPCAPGTVLEPASANPRHACNIRLERVPGPRQGSATLGFEVAATCTSRALRPCDALGAGLSPSAQHPITAIFTMSHTELFRPDPGTVTETESPEPSPGEESSAPKETEQPQPTETSPTEEQTAPEELPTDAEAPAEGET
jgi:hypothetical protein